MTPLSATEKEALLRELEAMRIEPEGARQTFVARLAQENGWRLSFAERVLNEYRRFLFLAATAGHAVTPSDEVDQTWHLHLAYSRHYWGELCGRILRRPLHHGPTAGGPAEASRYRDQYAATLQSYRRAFKAEPPDDIWPPERVRFGARYQRVDRRRNWVIPKAPCYVGVAGLLAAGCAMVTDPLEGSKTGAFVALSIFVALIVAVIYLVVRSRRGNAEAGHASTPACGGGPGGTGLRSDDHSADGDAGGCGGDGGGGGCGGGCGS